MEKKFNQPLGGNDMTRAGGPATMMRLPTQKMLPGLMPVLSASRLI